MKAFKITSLVLVCLCLLLSSVANAAIPCCCITKEIPVQNMDMPCHKEASNEANETSLDCDDCSCVTCLKTSAITEQPIENRELSIVKIIADLNNLYSISPNGLLQPPKVIS